MKPADNIMPCGSLFSLVGGRLVTLGDEVATLWDVHLDQRSPAEIAAFVERYSSWRLDGAQLVPK